MNIFNQHSELKNAIQSSFFGNLINPYLWKGLVVDVDLDGIKYNSIPGSVKVRVKGLHDYIDDNEDLPIVLPLWHYSGMKLRIPQKDEFVFVIFEYVEPIGQSYWITSIGPDISSSDYEKITEFSYPREVKEEIISIENNEIIKHVLNPKTYFQEEIEKDLIIIHHTASKGDPLGVINFWDNDSVEVATAYIIGIDGKIYQTFESDKMWAYHLKSDKLSTEKRSIGIELMNIGPVGKNLVGQYFDTYNKKYAGNDVIDLGESWRGFRYFISYPDIQIKSLKDLVNHLCSKHNISNVKIPNFFNYDSNNLLAKGIAGHISIRPDKTDPHLKFPLDQI